MREKHQSYMEKHQSYMREKHQSYMREKHQSYMREKHQSYMREKHQSYMREKHQSYMREKHQSYMREKHQSYMREKHQSYMREKHQSYMREKHQSYMDSTTRTSEEMLVDTMELKQYVENTYYSKVIVSNIIGRLDDGKANKTIRHFNEKLSKLDIMIMDNSNITSKYLGKRGLHLASPH